MTPEEHFRGMGEFIRGVELVGGTTPHAAMTVEMMRRSDDMLEKLWFAGCYALAYNWPTAEKIWQEWRPHDFSPADFYIWLEENWPGLPLRKERKAIFRKEAFTQSAQTYLNFARELAFYDPADWPQEYENAFAYFLSSCKYMGRYIGIRWLEVMRLAFGLPWEMPDVRADGGEHPRKALALLYPEDAPALLGGNRPHELAVTDLAADRLKVDLQIEYGIDASYYTLQSLLCEYKQSVLGKKHYPGKSIDTEMDYFRRVRAHWGDYPSAFYDVRARLFPEWSLGEVQGWDGVRPELGSIWSTYGYTWSDAVYDYRATALLGDFSDPILREGGVGRLLCV